MRNLITGAIVCALLSVSSAGQAQPADPQVMAPINKFIDSFNKGDSAGAAATHASVADLVIIDEVPPYVWHGAQAFKAWVADLERDETTKAITDQKVTLVV